MISFGAGIYLGIGIGFLLCALPDVGFAAGWRLAWRIPALILFWPGLFLAAIANQ